jgi:hypothetical protein
LDISQDAPQQIAAARIQQTRRRQRLQRGVEPGAQGSQQMKGNLVRQVAFQIAKNAARQTEEAHPDNRHLPFWRSRAQAAAEII